MYQYYLISFQHITEMHLFTKIDLFSTFPFLSFHFYFLSPI